MMKDARNEASAIAPARPRSLFPLSLPDVSVVIPAYNAASFLHRAIGSVFAQTRQPKEIVVVDDGSLDGTADVAKGLRPDIIVLRQENRGPGSARNAGVRATTSELVCFLDADDEYRPEMIATLSRALLEFPQAGVASGAFFIGCSPASLKRNPPANAVGVAGGYTIIADFFAVARRCNLVHTSAVMIRKRSFEAVGGFREDIRFGEDVDLWCKLAGRYDWAFVDTPVSIWRHSPSTSSTLRTHNSTWPTNILMNDEQMREHLRRELWHSFREFRRDWLTARARAALQGSATRRARELLGHIAPAPLSLNWAATWLLARAPAPLGQGILGLNRLARDHVD